MHYGSQDPKDQIHLEEQYHYQNIYTILKTQIQNTKTNTKYLYYTQLKFNLVYLI